MDFIFFTLQDHVFYSYLVAFSQLILLLIILISQSFSISILIWFFKALAVSLSFHPHCLFYEWSWYKEFEQYDDNCMNRRIETLVPNGANYGMLQIGKLLKVLIVRFMQTVCYNVLQYIMVLQLLSVSHNDDNDKEN